MTRASTAEGIRAIDDAAIDALDEPSRRQLAAIWAMRGGLELHVAGAFALVTRELLETGAEPSVLEITARAVEEEIEHARICLALAARHDGAKHAWPKPEPLFVPTYDGLAPQHVPALHVVALSCLNESIATVRLDAAIARCASPAVVAGLRAILTDEVKHARAGWAHLASRFVDDAIRREISLRLPAMIEASVAGTLAENAGVPVGRASLGLPSNDLTLATILSALEDVVLPGFERVGVDVGPARVWVAGARSRS